MQAREHGILLPLKPEHLCHEGLGLRGTLTITGLDERVACLLESVERALVSRDGERLRSGEEELRALFVVVRPEGESVLVLRCRRRKAVQPVRSIAGGAHCEPRSCDELVVASTRCADELERGAPVVREHLGMVLGPAETLDPLRRVSVLLGTIGAGDLSVGDVANERVGERELRLALD